VTAAAHRQLFALLAALAPVPPPALAALGRLLVRRSYPAGAWLLQAGQRAEQSFFIVRGLVREYYVSPDGTEHTRIFMAEGQLTGSLLDLLSAGPAVTWIQALEPTETLAFSYRDFEALCGSHPALERCARRVVEDLYVRKARREHQMLALTAKQRHAIWLAESPGLDARIRRRDLASYLGVTPEHLSRLGRRGAR
jgi:CRP-like cAMP-binding protein